MARTFALELTLLEECFMLSFSTVDNVADSSMNDYALP